MKSKSWIFGILMVAGALLVTMTPFAQAAGTMSADKAGTIGQPEGRLAFVRDLNLWVMNVDGSDQQMICQVGNADGRPSWSYDGRRIMFTRRGLANLQAPDNTGGMHKVYDLFIGWLDSAYANNTMYWTRLTDDLGSRDPDWIAPNKVVFYKDVNANTTNTVQPNYQICTFAPDGSEFEVLRKDWSNPGEQFLIKPTMNAKGDIVCEYFEKLQRIGLVTIPAGKYTMSMDDIAESANQNKALVTPAFSPDGKWVAYISNSMDDGGLYIATPDLKEKYLVTEAPVGTYINPIKPSFSPDSKWMTFSTQDGSIWIIDITGNGKRRLTGPGMDNAPAWSKK